MVSKLYTYNALFCRLVARSTNDVRAGSRVQRKVFNNEVLRPFLSTRAPAPTDKRVRIRYDWLLGSSTIWVLDSASGISLPR